MYSYRTTAAIAFVAALALAGCATAQGEGTPSEPAVAGETVRLGLTNPSCIAYFPVYVGIEQGFFEDEGITVEPVVANGSAAVLQAMLAGQADIGGPAATPLIFARVEGGEVKYIANSTPGGVFALVAPSDAGLDSAADLAGATIGISTADGGEVAFLEEIMRSAGLEKGDYETLVVGEAGQAIAGFTRGEIDAYAASIDGVATIEFGGIALDNLSGDDTGHLFGNGLAATEDYIADNGDTIEAFGRAFKAGLDAGLADPAIVTESCQAHQPQEVEDPEFVGALLEAVTFAYTPSGGAQFGENVEEHWQRVLDSLVAAGEVEEGAVEVSDLYTNEFVPAFAG